MEFDVREVGHRGYKELTVKEGNAKFDSGLLNDNEALSIGSDMFEASQELLGEDVHKLALLRAKYTPEDAMSGKYEILHAILEKDKYLNLAHHLEANRNDWNDGYWSAKRGLQGFTIDSNEDQEIYNCIYKITQYEDVDGRYFRDCEYNYGMLFGKVDAALYKDYEIVKEMMDD